MKDRRRQSAAINLEIGLRRLEREFAQAMSQLEADVAHLVEDDPARPEPAH